MAATAMLEAGDLTDFMYEKIGDVQGRGLTPVQVRILSRALKGVKVRRRGRGRSWCACCTPTHAVRFARWPR
jgi:hypothetical protein